MNKFEKFQSLLKMYYNQIKSSSISEKTESCISNDDSLDYVLNNLTAEKKQIIEKHILNCDLCLDKIKNLSRMLSDSDIQITKEPSKELLSKIKNMFITYFYDDIIFNLKAVFKDYDIIITDTDGKEGDIKKFKYRTEKTVNFKIDEEKSIEIILDYDGSKKLNLKTRLLYKTNNTIKYDVIIKKNNKKYNKTIKCDSVKHNIIKNIIIPGKYQLIIWETNPYYINLTLA